MAREQKGKEKNGDHTMSQPSTVFPVTPDVPPLKGSGIYLLLEPWTMKQAFFLCMSLGAISDPTSIVSVVCVLLDWMSHERQCGSSPTSAIPAIEEARCHDVYSPTQRFTGPVASGHAAATSLGTVPVAHLCFQRTVT